MKVIINHKICDMAPACGGISACPTGALYWDSDAGRIAHDESKCIGCGACEKACPVAKAIRLARNATQEKEIQAEYDADPRRAEDLFMDRYGGDIVLTKPIKSEDVMANIDTMPGLVVLELNKEDLITCLLVSIPMKELFDGIEKTHIKVINPSDELLAVVKVSEFPALVFFRDGKQIGKIEGFFENSQSEKSLLKSKIGKIIN